MDHISYISYSDLRKVTLCSFNKITVALSFSPSHRITNHALIHSRRETKASHFNPNTYITTSQHIRVKLLPNTHQLQVGASNKSTGMGYTHYNKLLHIGKFID